MPPMNHQDSGSGLHLENGVCAARNGISGEQGQYGSELADEVASQFDSIEDTISAFKEGNFIILLDSPSRENEGDLIIAAEDVTPSKLAFMVKYTSGLICAPLSSALADTLHLPLMVPSTVNTEVDGTAYTVSVDAVHASMSTGISAHDRALTSNLLASEESCSQDFRRPGHLFPLRARKGGVRERGGHTEATVELCRLAGKRPAGVLCELVEEGVEHRLDKVKKPEVEGADMRRRESCLIFGREWGIPVCTIGALVEYLNRHANGNGEQLGAPR